MRKKKRKQLEEDEALAKKLSEKEKRNYNNYYNDYPYYGTGSSTSNLERLRQHGVMIHNKYCSCGKTSTWNNNHIYDIHKRYCNCVEDDDDLDLSYNYNGNNYSSRRNYFNQGRKHEHGYRCCVMNHLHTVSCKCYYRDHVHDDSCCQMYHKHSVLCHCSHK